MYVLYKHNQIAVKTKCSQFSRLNETIAIAILQWNLIFSKLERLSEVKWQCSTEERETTFGSSYREVRKTEGSRIVIPL